MLNNCSSVAGLPYSYILVLGTQRSPSPFPVLRYLRGVFQTAIHIRDPGRRRAKRPIRERTRRRSRWTSAPAWLPESVPAAPARAPTPAPRAVGRGWSFPETNDRDSGRLENPLKSGEQERTRKGRDGGDRDRKGKEEREGDRRDSPGERAAGAGGEASAPVSRRAPPAQGERPTDQFGLHKTRAPGALARPLGLDSFLD